MKMAHECLHEEQIQGQSRAIERLDAELEYKKERLDDLKSDNEKMQQTLDEINKCVNKIVLASKNGDEHLKTIINKQDNRITALETTNSTLKWVIAIGFTGLASVVGLLAFLITHLH